MIEATPSRTRVFVSGLMRTFVVSGTCLMQTMIFTAAPPHFFARTLSLIRLRAITSRWIWLVPS